MTVWGDGTRPVYQVGGKSFLFFRTARPDAVDPETGRGPDGRRATRPAVSTSCRRAGSSRRPEPHLPPSPALPTLPTPPPPDLQLDGLHH